MFGLKMFPGGTHLHEGVNGKAVNGGNAIVELPAPARVVIPLSQHIGAPAKAIVAKGDTVTVSITAKGPVLGGLQADLCYDSDQLEVVNGSAAFSAALPCFHVKPAFSIRSYCSGRPAALENR